MPHSSFNEELPARSRVPLAGARHVRKLSFVRFLAESTTELEPAERPHYLTVRTRKNTGMQKLQTAKVIPQIKMKLPILFAIG